MAEHEQGSGGSPVKAGFVAGWSAGSVSVFQLVLIGTYISIGALAHDLGFPIAWVVLSTLIVWAAPAQVIMISALAAGAPPFEVAIAVTLTGVRLLPMVVALLPILRTRASSFAGVLLAAHFTAVSMWMESLRLAPRRPVEERIAFANGIGTALIGGATIATVAGYYFARVLPEPLVAGLLFLTPMSFLVSVARASKMISDRIAAVAGLVLSPLLVVLGVGLDLMWTGLIGGTAAYLVRRAVRARA
ncbi:AzlC family ABC transporter permease [Rhodoplanes sp. TEM]|uniref:AzlC family ABC transporter permease n=1 Tax=Rhodoplanes tepidamans TaxID=200616 RepID=A0ABT5J8E0_RHOTP|nr:MULTISPECIES: AzlC family ABC transporter permease [Rhodoplanes]MDC7785846.1 AzlC family ABC transporter permease [Rhodoplanes tepidamans]MDC7982763.1 AzlC family ABC transporter permease [Rhodoplanes sp. TEM]MDQ0357407.1 putative branched-subunit amino acid permease [Rhodoplanes tepidamans]